MRRVTIAVEVHDAYAPELSTNSTTPSRDHDADEI
jgi:hypothetical protein